jgi:hypothetical protein
MFAIRTEPSVLFVQDRQTDCVGFYGITEAVECKVNLLSFGSYHLQAEIVMHSVRRIILN